jgi:hypothetical protein
LLADGLAFLVTLARLAGADRLWVLAIVAAHEPLAVCGRDDTFDGTLGAPTPHVAESRFGAVGFIRGDSSLVMTTCAMPRDPVGNQTSSDPPGNTPATSHVVPLVVVGCEGGVWRLIGTATTGIRDAL